MKIIFFSTKPYDEKFFKKANKGLNHTLVFRKESLSLETVELAEGFDCACVFVNDDANESVIKRLKKYGVKILALRSAGFDHVAVNTAQQAGITIVNVPEYSPNAVAEHAVMLMLALNRKIYKALSRTRSYNFSLEGLIGFDMRGKTVGIIGTGKIGLITAKILQGFGCKIIAYNIRPSRTFKKLGIPLVPLNTLIASSDIISLHCPLTKDTEFLINANAIQKMKPGVMIINTARGKLIDTEALIEGLHTGQIGSVGLDVYEKEKGIFFEDKSQEGIKDEILNSLLSFPNVIVTSHQAFFTEEAMENIAKTVLGSTTNFEKGKHISNLLSTI